HTLQRLQGKTPRQTADYLPPAGLRLEELAVHIHRKDRQRVESWVPQALAQVAEPLGDKPVRRQFSKAWEREAQVAEAVRRLGKERANLLLVCAPGSGKTSVLVEAVQALERDAPGRLFWLTCVG